MGELLNKAIKINPENPYLWYYKGFYFWEKSVSNEENTTENQADIEQDPKAKDKQNACESWKIALSYGNEDAQTPLSKYCK
jgi:hypothetical protein